jgi:hypothetical protein
MKLDEFIANTTGEWAKDKQPQRLGQFVMNTLYRVRPDLYQKVTNTDSDPFYNDNYLWKLWEWLGKNW